MIGDSSDAKTLLRESAPEAESAGKGTQSEHQRFTASVLGAIHPLSELNYGWNRVYPKEYAPVAKQNAKAKLAIGVFV